ncbi:uncharacterized protein [Pyrus communis]|uniref:uncharacterized protein isoform X1 n=1 Tax=Pyrus communis TaxID=23211 RepID=UPI0035BFD0E7
MGNPSTELEEQMYERGEEVVEESKGGNFGEAMEGVASIALLPCGSLSGHFIRRQDSVNVCFGLQGTELACEKECSRGEDYRLIKLAIIDFNRKKEKVVVVECRGHDAARLQSIDHAHGWEEDVVDLVEDQHGKNKVLVSFNCETLKSDAAAEDHIRKFLPKLAGLDAVVNIGRMTISGLDFEAEE